MISFLPLLPRETIRHKLWSGGGAVPTGRAFVPPWTAMSQVVQEVKNFAAGASNNAEFCTVSDQNPN
jgi:hypothetical protein